MRTAPVLSVAALTTLAVVLVGRMRIASPGEQLIVHEWGTFTSLQDESGKAIGAINQDVERLPDFVRDYHARVGNAALDERLVGKGVALDPSITMRLETPVVYFHLPAGTVSPIDVDFSAEFRGGYLTQFYPTPSRADIPPQSETTITSQSRGAIGWQGLKVGTTLPGPSTDSPIWLAPRKVDAANVTAPTGESERYLFYRGVGHLDAPLKIVRKGSELHVGSCFDSAVGSEIELKIAAAWYLDVREDGKSAFRRVESPSVGGTTVTGSNFEFAEYSADRLATLRAEMKEQLVSAGLFVDEADAMLNTWESAYFKSAGSRIMFIVPRCWTDHYLPIQLSTPAQIQRVMVGRIDLVTPAQRELTRQYARMNPAQRAASEGQAIVKQIGRFGNAIVADELARPAKPQSSPISRSN